MFVNQYINHEYIEISTCNGQGCFINANIPSFFSTNYSTEMNFDDFSNGSTAIHKPTLQEVFLYYDRTRLQNIKIINGIRLSNNICNICLYHSEQLFNEVGHYSHREGSVFMDVCKYCENTRSGIKLIKKWNMKYSQGLDYGLGSILDWCPILLLNSDSKISRINEVCFNGILLNRNSESVYHGRLCILSGDGTEYTIVPENISIDYICLLLSGGDNANLTETIIEIKETFKINYKNPIVKRNYMNNSLFRIIIFFIIFYIYDLVKIYKKYRKK
ncbi:MAG: hypothetical protein JKX76_01255 [Colwellia sp.]|nr:hypothetical protein [Colwellia sp.]